MELVPTVTGVGEQRRGRGDSRRRRRQICHQQEFNVDDAADAMTAERIEREATRVCRVDVRRACIACVDRHRHGHITQLSTGTVFHNDRRSHICRRRHAQLPLPHRRRVETLHMYTRV